ncbi:hypothetical protein TNCV_3002531 [Trichonephila clavipes]|nr:hypothetical protein TNCV_3002531 [Trichonephila clavipes]
MRNKDPETDIGHERKPLPKRIAKLGREGNLGYGSLVVMVVESCSRRVMSYRASTTEELPYRETAARLFCRNSRSSCWHNVEVRKWEQSA